jgi:uncharacterized membrane protein YphA (DoxX/SURF4 family)
MRWTMDLLFFGFGGADLAIALNRIAVGAFFMLSGYHKLFNAERHRSIVDELKALGVPAYKPIDESDRIDDWLYLPETLYAFMLLIVVSAGAGPYSLDALILGLINKRVG